MRTHRAAGLKWLDQVVDLLLGFGGSLRRMLSPARHRSGHGSLTFKNMSNCFLTLSIAVTLSLVSLIRSSFCCWSCFLSLSYLAMRVSEMTWKIGRSDNAMTTSDVEGAQSPTC